MLIRLLRCPGGRWLRAAWGALALASLAGLLLNIGRSGQLAFFVALAALLTRHLPGPRLLRPLVAAAATAALLALAYLSVPTFRGRAGAALAEVEGALVRQEYVTNQGKRIASWIASLEVMVEHPLLGTGVGDAVDAFHRTVRERHPDLVEAVREYRHLHNQYLQVGVELGLLGLLALLNVFLQLLRVKTGRPELDDVARAVGWVFLVGCVGDPFLRKQLPLTLFALLCGLVVAGGRHAEAPAEVPHRPEVSP
jgi:O-antigen ligase